MPFKSKAQQGFMFANHPEMAKEWADKTPDISALPEHAKKMAAGGDVTAGNPSDMDPGVQDATVSDFLAPFLLAPSGMAEGLGSKLADEAGEITIGRAAPKMEEAAEAASPKVEAFIKGVQKSPNGNEVKIWGVRGDPDEISKLGYGSDPASVPEHILRAKGILPTSIDAAGQAAPNGYADGGVVAEAKKVKSDSQAADDIDPVVTAPTTSTDTPKGYAKGGFPHVTFMEDQTPAEVKKTVHMSKGGELSHDKKLSSIYKAMGIKKYADGGAVDDVDPSQLPTGTPPSPSDPTYWDQIKAALGAVGNTMSSALPTMPGVAAGAANVAATPGIAPAVNAALGSNLAEPPMPPAPDASAPPAPVAPVTPPPAMAAPSAPPVPSANHAGMPNLGTMFNQDTSKLTQGSNPEDRQALVNKLQGQQEGLGAIIAQAVSGLGDAIAAKGGKEQHSLQNIFAMDKTQRDEALANFDQMRQDRVQKLQLQTQMGDNALKQAAAADAYGTDEHLNQMIGAPKGTMKKDLPTYFSLMSAQVAQQEKNADLYMKAHLQAGTDVDNAVKNSSILGIKPSPAQLQASGAKLADQYYNRAKGNILVKPSDGGQAQWIPTQNLGKAKQMDPNLTVQP